VSIPGCQNALRDQVVFVLDRAVPDEPNVMLIGIAALAAVVTAVIARSIVLRPANLRRYDPDAYDARWRGFKGFLLVIVVACIIEPLRVAFMLACNDVVFMRETWSVLTRQSHHFSGSFGEPMLIAQAIIPAMQCAFAIALVVAMLKRKRVFRGMTIGYLIGSLVMLAINEFMLNQVFSEYREVLNENSRRLTTLGSVALPTIGYLLLSRRVQATFHR
jgi:hypothetical protein